jgi:hypothetical protein
MIMVSVVRCRCAVSTGTIRIVGTHILPFFLWHSINGYYAVFESQLSFLFFFFWSSSCSVLHFFSVWILRLQLRLGIFFCA